MVQGRQGSGKLLLTTNTKSHMGFRLVPKSVTLNDLERRNDHVVCVISRNAVAFCAYYVGLNELKIHVMRLKCSQKNLLLSGISLIAIFAGDHPQRGR